ncbi:hypothetical protein EXN66_Car017353 [Channa argus]|uniref:Apolipoprotein L3 n=1 Tax=Channa argus TaxID=215402 RepID=A0A6G1QGH9_CHAAH|nr:hypothetical protein EXN66_Car017353 [Channa argus]KAK2887915.1 hypothetical protein Q8A73_019363 [Channa argus]
MASSPKRRDSKELPPEFSELMDKLCKAADSFIKLFDNSEDRMRQIAAEIQKLADDVKHMQMLKNSYRIIGGVVLTLGAVAPLTGGISLAAAGAVATFGGATVVYTNVKQMLEEKQSAKIVEELGKEFMEIFEPMKNDLEDIQTTCEKLEQKSAEVQAKNTLSDMEVFQRILKRVSELGKNTKKALIVAVTMVGIIRDLLVLLLGVFRVTATTEEDQKLTDAIIQSADQSLKTIDEFKKMKEGLREFTEN